MSYGRTQKERGWDAINAIANPSQKADVREYVIYLEGRLRESREKSNARTS